MSDQTNKPVLDQQAFEKLLQAAYVLQEHNRKMRELEETLEAQTEQLREQELATQPLPLRGKPESEARSSSNGDYTLTLAEIVEAQHQIQMRRLELDKAMAVIAERVSRITGASGAAIGILDGAIVRYRAAAGSTASPAGSEVPLHQAICQANIRTGQVIRSEDVTKEILFDSEPCLRRGILSLVAVPVYHEGDIVGALELHFDRIHGFAEHDIHTCQLMAGLVTEAIGREAPSNFKRPTMAERSTIVAETEGLKRPPSAQGMAATTGTSISVKADLAVEFPCWKCGNNLVAEEQFCGGCGAARADDSDPSKLPSKLASAYRNDQAIREKSTVASSAEFPSPKPTFAKPTSYPGAGSLQASDSGDQAEDLVEQFSLPMSDKNDRPSALSYPEDANEDAMPESWPSKQNNEEALSTVLVKPEQEAVVWNSAAKARDFLESLAGTREPGTLARFWRARRGDFYLAVAIILVLIVIRWGIWSNPSVGATGRGTAAYGSTSRSKAPGPDADLSLFDKVLVGLGLAEAPDAPQYKGNPNTQVWVDLHTALYYCPGSDLYGKTPKGKMASQRDAQLDQFEPANRKACD